MPYTILLTCEHASNAIPQRFQHYFVKQQRLLATHMGWDIGAQQVFNYLKKYFSCPNYRGKYSRLLIDLNRTLKNPILFHPLIGINDPAERQQIVAKYYTQYRSAVVSEIEHLLSARGAMDIVLHLSIHSFTPVFNGIKRNCDLGILYDPKISLEKTFATQLKTQLHSLCPSLPIRMNYPYLGTSDGFTSSLRKLFPQRYIGIELELNQRLFRKDGTPKTNIAAIVATAVEHSLMSSLRGTKQSSR